MGNHKQVGRKRTHEMLLEHYRDPRFKLTYDEVGDLLHIASKFFETHDDEGVPFVEQDIEPSPVDCGSNSCLVAWPVRGMRVNNGCTCFIPSHNYEANKEMALRARKAIQYWRRRARNAEAVAKTV